MKRGKAQVSLEYLILLSVALALIIAAMTVFFVYSKNSTSSVTKSRIAEIGNEVVYNAESLYGIGDGSRVILETNFPEEIQEVYVLDGVELVMVIRTPQGISESLFFSKVQLNGTSARPAGGQYIGAISPGKNFIRIESKGDYILLNAS
ncbi:class III signal peptide-containing protein [Candidatus Woesearchaeota archaeon]|nr:MAG: class III signal peptide-containing protein [Candidatus Woesearchaeota archaeon]